MRLAFYPSLAVFLAGALASTPEGLPGNLAAPAAQTLGHGRFSAGISAFGHNDASMVAGSEILFVPGAPDTILFQDLVSVGIRPHLAVGLSNVFDLGLSLPIYADLISEPPRAANMSGVAVGDLRLVAKVRAPLPTEALAMALAGGFTVPSKSHHGFLPKGSELAALDSTKAPNRTTFSAEKVALLAMGLLTMDLTRLETPIPFRLDLSGGVLNQPAALGGGRLQWSGSLEWSLAPRLGFYAALAGQATLDRAQGLGFREDARFNIGVSVRDDGGFFVDGGVQFAVSDRPYYPYAKLVDGLETATYKARALPGIALGVQVGWTGSFITSDSDRDGVPDKIDACPKESEDFDGFQDADGCPEADNDEDGIPDLKDKCATQAEDKDGIQDEDGCPETDYDGDAVRDEEDRCPLEPEDRDGFEDMDGCPDLDNDKDNVLDSQDKCPHKLEDKDGFQDEDGCPETDNDTDGLLDSLDKCPNEPETINGYQDLDGCPETGMQPGPAADLPRVSVLRKVQFEGQTATLSSESYESLDSLAEAMNNAPRIQVEIRVHSDDRGPEKTQLRLTQARAESVRKHLALKGVDKTRIVARGMGSKSPIASNRTPQGRLKNRRVEIVRVD